MASIIRQPFVHLQGALKHIRCLCACCASKIVTDVDGNPTSHTQKSLLRRFASRWIQRRRRSPETCQADKTNNDT